MQCRESLLILCLLVPPIFFSCSKADKEAESTRHETLLIQQARSYFEKEVLSQPVLGNPSTELSKQSLKKEVDWDRGNVQKLKFGETVVVPLHISDIYVSHDRGRTKLPFTGSSYLIVYEDKEKKKHAEVVLKLPDEKSIKNSFSGVVLVEDWNGKILKSYKYQDNRELEMQTVISINERGLQTETEFICYETAWYTCVSVGGVDYGCTYNYSTTTCSSTGGGSGGTGGDGDSGGGGDGGGSSDPGGGGGGDGYGGIGGASSVTSIVNALETPCFLDAYKSAMDGNLQNHITTTICNMIDASDKIELRFEEAVIGEPGTVAKTYPSGSGGYLRLRLVLDKVEMAKASKEYIIATIYHELLHCYFTAKGINPLTEHNEMGTFYVDMMASAIRGALPGTSHNVAWALAWGGAENSYGWSQLVREDENAAKQIIVTNSRHKMGMEGTKCQ